MSEYIIFPTFHTQIQTTAPLTKQYYVKLQNFKDKNKLSNGGKWKIGQNKYK